MQTTVQKLIALLFVLAACACTTPLPPASVPVGVSSAKLAPPPPDVMVPRQANFRQRLVDFFSISKTNPTPSSSSSEPLKK